MSTPPHKIGAEVVIERNVKSGTFRFTEIFSGFDKVGAVKEVFGAKTSLILGNLSVEVFPKDGYMGVSDEDGHIFASQTYLNTGERFWIYLDIVHELVHVRQFMEGKELFDKRYAYVDRPTEIEAYKIAANEARRIGLSEKEIFTYLEVPWISRKEHERLAGVCNVPPEIFKKSNSKK